MHGILFGEFKKFIDTHIGGNAWSRLLKQTGLANRFYTPVQEYPDEEFFALINAAEEEVGLDTNYILMLFGQFVVPDLLSIYHRQINPEWPVMDVLTHLEDTVHAVLHRRNPSARLPNFTVEQVGDHKILIHYTSPHKLCYFGKGLIQGLAMEYDDPISIRETSCMLHGDTECLFEIIGEQKEEAPTRKEPRNFRKSRPLINFNFLKKRRESRGPVIQCAGGPPIIIVGMGLAGIRVAHEILRAKKDCMIMLYGDEPWEPYNRVRLSELLAGDLEWGDLSSSLGLTTSDHIVLLMNTRVEKIDLKKKTITDEYGKKQPYSSIVLATGSRARPADLNDRELAGIYTYRNVEDAQSLLVQVAQSTSTVVIGGGILGIEVAFALRQQNQDVAVTIIHRNSFLMNRELDKESADFLLQQVRKVGIEVRLDSVVTEYIGKTCLEQIVLSNGTVLPCDTLIFCTGILPNTDLAKDCGLEIGRGIKVNGYMQTSDPAVYAVGECIEYNGRTYGTLAPCTEQAAVAADNILHGNHRLYRDSHISVRAKIKHLPVFSLKAVDRKEYDEAHVTKLSFCQEEEVIFRQLILYRGRIVGAQGVGAWNEINTAQEAINRGMRIWPWRKWYFLRHGAFSPDITPADIMQLHQTAVICCCNNVTREELSTVFSTESKTLDELSRCTGAGQSCGSCTPLLAQFTESPEDASTLKAPSSGNSFFGFSLVAALLPVLFVLPGISVPKSVHESNTLSVLLQHGLFQQISGYTVLFFFLMTFILSVNKHFNLLTFLHYITWRTLHVLVAASAGAALLLHTNFSIGKGYLLHISLLFSMVVLTGGSLSMAIALERSFFSFVVRKYRFLLLSLHWMFATFFTVYVCIHIVASYYF